MIAMQRYMVQRLERGEGSQEGGQRKLGRLVSFPDLDAVLVIGRRQSRIV